MGEFYFNLFLASVLILIVCINFRMLYSQTLIGNISNSFFSPNVLSTHSPNLKNHEKITITNKSNYLKFFIPEKTSASIKITDEKGTLIKTFEYQNINYGTYELNLIEENLPEGTYNILLSAGNYSENLELSAY